MNSSTINIYAGGGGGTTSSGTATISGGGGGGSVYTASSNLSAGAFYAPYIPLTTSSVVMQSNSWQSIMNIDLDHYENMGYRISTTIDGTKHNFTDEELKLIIGEYIRVKELAAEFPVVESALNELNMVVRLHSDVGPSLEATE